MICLKLLSRALRIEENEAPEKKIDKLSAYSLDEDIKNFWMAREEKKKRFYWQVQKLGFIIMLTGAIVQLSFGSLLSYSPLLFNILAVSGSSIRMTGNCIYSSVPVEELDIFIQLLMDKNSKMRKLLSLVIIAIVFSYGLASLYFRKWYYIISGTLSLLLGLFWVPNLFRETSYSLLSLQFNSFFITMSLVLTFNNLYYYYLWDINPVAKLVYPLINILPALYISYISYEGLNIDARKKLRSPLKEEDISQIKKDDLKSKRFLNAAGEFNAALYSISIVSGGVCWFIQGILGYFVGENIYFIIGSILCGIFDLLPLMVVLYFGPSRCFWFIAHFYEYKHENIIEDGVFMATLISKCNEVVERSEVRWLKRKSEFPNYYLNEGVKRFWWMKATLDKNKGVTKEIKGDGSFHVMTLKVDYAEDVNPSIVYKYHSNLQPASAVSTTTTTATTTVATEGTKMDTNTPEGDLETGIDSHSVVLITDIKLSDEASAVSRERIKDFKSWKERFFDFSGDLNLIGTDIDSGVIIVQEKIKDNSMTKEKLKEIANKTLRRFDMADFHESILSISPRELMTSDQKEAAYSLSQSVTLTDQIDYFVSHSWEDKPDIKYTELNAFSTKFQARYGRTPLLWLDKVCIDQRDPSFGLAVLPVNINVCRKFLILLSKTYLRRLWCIWELFTLFCFVSKESVVFDRIEFLVIDGSSIEEMVEDLRGFDIDEAVCFGPNEEFQLRYIILKFDPTGERMKNCFRELAKMLENTMKGTKMQQLLNTAKGWIDRADKTQVHPVIEVAKLP